MHGQSMNVECLKFKVFHKDFTTLVDKPDPFFCINKWGGNTLSQLVILS